MHLTFINLMCSKNVGTCTHYNQKSKNKIYLKNNLLTYLMNYGITNILIKVENVIYLTFFRTSKCINK